MSRIYFMINNWLLKWLIGEKCLRTIKRLKSTILKKWILSRKKIPIVFASAKQVLLDPGGGPLVTIDKSPQYVGIEDPEAYWEYLSNSGLTKRNKEFLHKKTDPQKTFISIKENGDWRPVTAIRFPFKRNKFFIIDGRMLAAAMIYKNNRIRIHVVPFIWVIFMRGFGPLFKIIKG